jgi:hypothetical protein
MIDITRENVEKALDEIDGNGSLGVPSKRKSTTYCLDARGRHYPPKYVLMRAHILQTGIKPDGLIGGAPSNTPLRDLGYVILDGCGCGNTCNFSN